MTIRAAYMETTTRLFMALALVAVVMVFLSSESQAGNMTAVLCNVAYLIQKGGIGSAIATLVVITLGISAMLGKISWGMALIVCTGIALVFGANSLVSLAVGANNVACSNVS